MTPVVVITGFLGSGKTTLLRQLLRDPAMGRTAVIMNEFGEIGIDHDLIETSDESLVQLTTGCLCCKISNDLVLTLKDLAERRSAGTIMSFDRVVIETSGLADPAPILQALMADPAIIGHYSLHRVITLVDAVNGLATLEIHEQALRQVALADRLVITKSDLPQALTTDVRARLKRINPMASVLSAVQGSMDSSQVFDLDPENESPALRASYEAPHRDTVGHEHRDDISSFCMVLDLPVAAATLALFLEAVADNCGQDLLRLKGIVRIAERPDTPVVVHGVQHIFHPLEWLDKWPSSDRRSRIVFITRDIPEAWFRTLFEVLAAEVEDESKKYR